MQKIDSLSYSESLEGIYTVKLDSKNRIQIPRAWQQLFGERQSLVIMNTGKYGILLSKKEFENFAGKGDIITHTKDLDTSFRFLIASNFFTVHGIIPEEHISLIGRGNHIEVYFHSEELENTKIRSIQSAVALQVELIQKRKQE